ncbi:hypothetical protein B5F18_03770 [Lachnoclostridium sp. An181]|nr:hypothetical protein B5F18_03770 [Lachnoclostridium sp. An181]
MGSEGKFRFIRSFVLRMIVGVVCIVLVNQYLNIKDIDISVGLNPISVGVSAVLGVPGVALMYGILFYQNFNS